MLKLREGAYYLTRDGRVAGPIRRYKEGAFYWKGPLNGDRENDTAWYADGRFYTTYGSPLDLVSECSADGSIIYTDDIDSVRPRIIAEGSGAASAERSELERLPTESEEEHLRRLVRVANAGLAAAKELHAKPELKAQVEWRSSACNWEPLRHALHDEQLRIKPKPARPKPKPPAFPEFYVGPVGGMTVCGTLHNDVWLVRLEGGLLHVGCKWFNAKDALTNLRSLCNGGPVLTLFDLGASRKGVSCDAGTLSWADADRLLAALESYFADLAAWEKEAA